MLNNVKSLKLIVLFLLIIFFGAIVYLNALAEKEIKNGGARRVIAAKQIKTLKEALDIYRLHNEFYPSTEQGLVALVTKPTTPPEPKKYVEGGYMKIVPLDPWGNPFIYRNHGDNGHIDIISCGPDGEEGGEDDITNNYP